MAETKITQNEISLLSRQSGFDYINITSPANTVSKTVTFPTAFSVAPKSIQVTPTGYVTGGAPTALSASFTPYGSGFAIGVSISGVSTTGFTVSLTAAGSNNFGVSYTGSSWTAET